MLVLELVGGNMAPSFLWATETEGEKEGDYSSLLKNYIHASWITYMTQNHSYTLPSFAPNLPCMLLFNISHVSLRGF